MIASMDEVFAVQRAGESQKSDTSKADLVLEVQTAAGRAFLEMSAVYLNLSHRLQNIIVKEMHEIGDAIIDHSMK
ncbi:MAG TPA: hypothetical protein VLB83_03605 [Candidatus Paceibacterota bacterium]|nr:hypothetical protein [Candidatus Paceibacterota bacterium]